MAWPAVNRPFTQESFRDYVDRMMWPSWRPSMIVWHNTAAPTLKQWMKSSAEDNAAGRAPGITRINNLSQWYQRDQGWPGSPHLFIADDYIWVMNPLNKTGTHSPSWNGVSIGMELIGDYSIEDDDSGSGLKVKNNAIYATAVLCSALGLVPNDITIKLHKQDPKTTHDCPGKNLAQDKAMMILSVQRLMEGGEHDPDGTASVIAGRQPASKPVRLGTTTTAGLNFRIGPGVMYPSKSQLPAGVKVKILSEAKNGTTKWLWVLTPAGYDGWVAADYVEELA